jgi:ferredoxin-NADP reductase
MTEAIAASARWQSCATPAIKSFFLCLSETFDYTAGQHVDVRLTAPNGYTGTLEERSLSLCEKMVFAKARLCTRRQLRSYRRKETCL